MTYSDDDLRTYFMGHMPPDQAAALEQALHTDAGLARRMMALDPAAGDVKQAFAALVRPVQSIPTRSVRGGAAPIAASLAAAVALFAAGWWAKPVAPTGWMAEVAAYQALYVAQTVDIETNTADQMTQLIKVGGAIGRDVTALQAGGPGVTFKRAQILGYDAQPIAQLVYQGHGGTPIALCLIKTRGAGDTPIVQTMKGMASAHWRSGDHDVLLIGGQDEQMIRVLAQMFQNRLKV
ncbi:MAG: hypothetical protein AAF701_04295 [Pseudomonadota bacterium]